MDTASRCPRAAPARTKSGESREPRTPEDAASVENDSNPHRPARIRVLRNSAGPRRGGHGVRRIPRHGAPERTRAAGNPPARRVAPRVDVGKLLHRAPRNSPGVHGVLLAMARE